MIFEDRVGYLDVLSEPEGAEITIDNEEMRAFTCRTFVASLTDHTVVVVKAGTQVNCTVKVKQKDNMAKLEPKTIVCPNGKPTKCSLA